MTGSLVDRFRQLPADDRAAFFAKLGEVPGALSDLRYDFEGAWAREDQIIPVEELDLHSLIVFAGPRGGGKTRSAIQLFIREIEEGRSTRPRIIAATKADVENTVVKGLSGIMACLPPERRPLWVVSKGAAGTLIFPNGVEVLCYSADVMDSTTGGAGDLDLYDDIAKWGPRAEAVYYTARTSCRAGRGIGIIATTRRGTKILRKLLKKDMEHVLVRRPENLRANRFNLAAHLYTTLEAEIGGTDYARQELDDEDISANSPFDGLEFEDPPIRALEAPRVMFDELILSVDPADGKGGSHDEWGIGVAVRMKSGHIVALDDLSGSFDDDEAGEVIILACELWMITKIVAEANRGLQSLRNALRAAYYKRELEKRGERRRAMPELIGITAKDKKKIRAGATRVLYIEGLVQHMPGLVLLEKQMREWDPDAPPTPRCDDRIDWLVHAIHYLAKLSEEGELPVGDQLDGLAEKNRQLQARAGTQREERSQLMQSTTVPPGDPRYRAKLRHVGLGKRNIL